MIHPFQTPPPLQPGNLLRVIAPSGRLTSSAALDRGIEIWRERGYRVEVMDVMQSWGYLAGEDGFRRNQLAAAWTDPECRAILCVRGGYGGMRLLEDWQWQPLATPKWTIGFSDITALLWSQARHRIGGGIHGPLLTTLAEEPDWSRDRLFDLVCGKPLSPLSGESWVGGMATGQLLPCNLTVATHLLGTPIQPDLNGVILAIEDVTEAPYRIDRMLTHWRLTGLLSKVAGIAIGRFSQCDPPTGSSSFTVEEVLRDRLTDLQIPVVAKFPFGHDGCNAALPVGAVAILDGDNGKLTIEQLKTR